MKKKRRWLRTSLIGIGLAALLGVAWLGFTVFQVAKVTTAAVAKAMCSGMFVSGRTPEAVFTQDLRLPEWMDEHFRDGGLVIDEQARRVTGSAFGLARRVALYREGLGCTLPYSRSVAELEAEPAMPQSLPSPAVSTAFEQASLVSATSLDAEAIEHALDEAFAEPDQTRLVGTRALVVVHQGQIIAERYAPGFSATTRLLGYSMSKSVISTLAGLRVAQGALSLQQDALLPEWRSDDDPRRGIRLEHLLLMTTGLEFQEDYTNPLSDAIRMLSMTDDAARFAAARPLQDAPGARWHYSSGNNIMLSKVIRLSFEGDEQAYREFPRRALFDPLGMTSAIMEPDSSGTFLFCYATARDWARFGQLYVNNGLWNGAQVLPEEWVRYTHTAGSLAPGATPYGGQFWLNAPAPDAASRRWPDVPADAYAAIGFEGQYVLIIPSRQMVIARLGKSVPMESWDLNEFARQMLAAAAGATDG